MIIASVIFAVALAALVTDTVCRCLTERLARSAEPLDGSGFDASAVSPRISSVRQDYLAEIHAHQRESDYHQELMASARQAVLRLSFFQRRHIPGPMADQHS